MDVESSSCKRKQRFEIEDERSIPEDVAIEILTRMPVKSLLKFKRVCKRWYNIIESPKFIRAQFDNPNNHTRLLTQYCNTLIDDTCNHSVAIYPDKTLTESPIVYDDITQFHLVSSIVIDKMIGPVDGMFLLCISFKSDLVYYIALWNPATADFMYVPNGKLESLDYLLGFGLDLSSMKYKVVWRRFKGLKCDGVVYTFGCDAESCDSLSVIQTKDSIDEIVSDCNRLYVNGKFYWLVWGKDKAFLVSFDMSTDELKMIKGPSNDLGMAYIILTEINGSIAVIGSDSGQTWCESINSWVLNEESWWTKNPRTTYESDIAYGNRLGFLNNMKELLYQLCKGELMLYDFSDGVKKFHLGIHGDYDWFREYNHYMEVYNYKESLFSFGRSRKQKLRKDELCSMFKNFSIVNDDYDDDAQYHADKRRK